MLEVVGGALCPPASSATVAGPVLTVVDGPAASVWCGMVVVGRALSLLKISVRHNRNAVIVGTIEGPPKRDRERESMALCCGQCQVTCEFCCIVVTYNAQMSVCCCLVRPRHLVLGVVHYSRTMIMK